MSIRASFAQKNQPSANAGILQEDPELQGSCLVHKISDTALSRRPYPSISLNGNYLL